jgi:hypothetical protein
VAAAGGADLRVVARELLAKDVALLEALLGDGQDQLVIAARWVLGGGLEQPPGGDGS